MQSEVERNSLGKTRKWPRGMGDIWAGLGVTAEGRGLLPWNPVLEGGGWLPVTYVTRWHQDGV